MQTWFKPGAFAVFHIGTARKSWPHTIQEIDKSPIAAHRKIVVVQHSVRTGVIILPASHTHAHTLMPLPQTIVTMGHDSTIPGRPGKPRVPIQDVETKSIYNRKWLGIIIDEAHNYRTGGADFNYLLPLVRSAHLKVLVTATPLFQSPKVCASPRLDHPAGKQLTDMPVGFAHAGHTDGSAAARRRDVSPPTHCGF